MTCAHFPVSTRLDDFDFGRIKGIGRSEAVNLLDRRWVDTKQNLLFFGPPGIGKIHLAIAFGRQAVEKSHRGCFERVTNLIKMQRTAEVQKTN
jgi:DNA replication protein DnaC